MTRFDPQTTLLIVALENELPRDTIADWTIIYTGVGKVNATIALGDAIAMHQPKQVVNYGSASALRPGLAGLHRVTRFLQCYMDHLAKPQIAALTVR
jgi:adenosylhomocysteine nucleosidase